MSNSEATRSVVVPEKTTMFTQTCDRLREYLKEQRGPLPGMTLQSSSSSPFSAPPSPRTIALFPTSSRAMVQNDFLPHHAPMAAAAGEPDQKPTKQQTMMTIFYGGKVIVLENVPSDKATEVMRLASIFSSSSSSPAPVTPADHTSSISSAMPNLGRQQKLHHQSPQAFVRDLSLTRSRSLTRFLEKRKDRINARAPYTLSDSSKPVEASTKSWLGLAAPNH